MEEGIKFFHFLISAIVIGFEEEEYTFQEPEQIMSIEEVCMVITQGTIGTELVVIPRYSSRTARSKSVLTTGEFPLF
jgi:hypothetical protein